MMQVIYTVCALAVPDSCETHLLSFIPRLPLACIFAAGPELEAVVKEDEQLVSWSCSLAPWCSAEGETRMSSWCDNVEGS